jgi:hypothetical protein
VGRNQVIFWVQKASLQSSLLHHKGLLLFIGQPQHHALRTHLVSFPSFVAQDVGGKAVTAIECSLHYVQKKRAGPGLPRSFQRKHQWWTADAEQQQLSRMCKAASACSKVGSGSIFQQEEAAASAGCCGQWHKWQRQACCR